VAEKGRSVMAEPGGAVEVTGAVAVAKGDPDVLLAQIERTREDLARTIDSLAERVSPAGNVRMLRAKVAEQAARPEVQLGAAAVGVAVVGLAILRMWARHRRDR
jgi:DNA-binding NarL/FixJ family response regulator